MATYSVNNARPAHSCEYGNNTVLHDNTTIGAALALADVVRLAFVPAGTEVHRVVVKVTDMDTDGSPALAAKLGFAPADGSSAVSGADTAVASAAAWAQSAATTTYEIFPPYKVDVDSWLQAVVTTAAATGAAGTAHAKVEGVSLGPP